jgi:hypothetical protein
LSWAAGVLAVEETEMLQWEGPVQKWALHYAASNLWRLPIYEVSDLQAEAWLIFNKIVVSYPVRELEVKYADSIAEKGLEHVVVSVQMSLFKVSFVNQIHDLSKESSNRISKNSTNLVCADSRHRDDRSDGRIRRVPHGCREARDFGHPDFLSGGEFSCREVELRLDLERSSAVFHRLLARSSWDAGPRRMRGPLRRADGTRETTNEILCRLAGEPSSSLLREELDQII